MTLRGSRLLCGLPCGLLCGLPCGLLCGLLRGLLSGLLLLVAGCYDAPVPAPHGRVVLDMVGRQVQLPAEIKRVAAVRPGALRLLTYVEGCERVAAVESVEQRRRSKPYLMAYPQLAQLPSLGPPHGGDPELIAGLDLDVVISTRLSARDADRWQERTGVPFVVIGYGDLGGDRETLDQSLRLLGEVLERPHRARQVMALFDAVAADLKQRTAGISAAQRQEAYVAGVAYRGAQGVVSTEPGYEPFQLAGAKNVAQALGSGHAIIDREMLVWWDPPHLFIDQASTALVMRDLRRPELAALRAVAEKRVHALLPYNWYWTNFGTVLANAYAVGKVLYPGQFADVNIEERAGEIYRALLGQDVYPAMRAAYGGYGALAVR